MPGIVVFNRRWSVGSDDLVVPGVFLLLLHTIWMIVLSNILAFFDFGDLTQCILDLHEHVLGYIIIMSGCIVVEACIAWVSMRGSILYSEPRVSMEYLLYVRLGFMVVEVGWLIIGVVWLVQHYASCPVGLAKEAVLGIIVCNWCVMLSVLITIWCTFDAAGRSWVKMKRYQRSLRDAKTKFHYKRSGSTHRDWRHRKVMRAYQESWNTRCRLLCCCMRRSDQHRNSFAEIAKLLSEFFRDLDVVPSDVIAGLVLLRKFQRLERQAIVAQKTNQTYEFLSGVPITPASKFLSLNDAEVLEHFKDVIHYMQYALSAYGWPMYLKINSGTGVCRLCPYLRCCCCSCCGRPKSDRVHIVEDNCCECNYAALQKLSELTTVDMVYVTYHVEVGETPFFVAVDHDKKKIVISIRGTLSMQDIITDLNAEGEQLPMENVRDDWLGHKGMVQAAEYIRAKLCDERILSQAFEFDLERGTASYGLILLGHSLGAGTAAILAILLKQDYPDLHCYAYSPPGGLLSLPAVEYTKSFITSVVVGKDVVPRIGLHQMEALRTDLFNAIKRTNEPKWKIIAQSMMCCAQDNVPEVLEEVEWLRQPHSRNLTCHPSDSSIALTAHQPLYPPGRIIHVVRHHPTKDEHKYDSGWRKVLTKNEPVYQALWADNVDFDEVLISPVMIQDHMPDKVLEALKKVLQHVGPAKPQRVFLTEEHEKNQLLPDSNDSSPLDRTPPHKLCLETSFTDLNPENGGTSNRSSTYSESGIDPLNASLSWEYPSALEEHMIRNLRPQKANGYPTAIIGMPARRVDLLHDDWLGLAPLASPETLSDASSIGSRGSRVNVGTATQQRFAPAAGNVPKMETIAQSPANKGSNDGYCFYVDIPVNGANGKQLPSSPPVTSSPARHLPTAPDLSDGEDDDDGDIIDVTVTRVELEPILKHETNIVDLESDGDEPKYDLARLSFYLTGEDSPKRKEAVIGNGSLLDCSCRGMNLSAARNVGNNSPLPNSPREKRVTFQLDQIQDMVKPEKPKTPLPITKFSHGGHPDSKREISCYEDNVNFPGFSPQQEYGISLYAPYPHYGYSNHSPFQSPTVDLPNLDLYQTNLANTISSLQQQGRNINSIGLNNKVNGRSDKVSDSSGIPSDDISSSDVSSVERRPNSDDLESPSTTSQSDITVNRDTTRLSPDTPVKMFFQSGQFTEESSV